MISKWCKRSHKSLQKNCIPLYSRTSLQEKYSHFISSIHIVIGPRLSGGEGPL